MALVALLAALVLPRALEPPRPVQVPPLTGQTLEAARSAARQAGLALTVVETPSETVPRGVVTQQEPPPGTTVLSSQPVRVVVSGGLPPVQVPDLRGRRLEDARRDLAAVGLNLGAVSQREVAEPPWGTVVAQSARAGAYLERGAAVDLTLGVPPWTTAPALRDLQPGEAQAELERRGLRLGAVRLLPVADKRAGSVVAQEPAPEVRLRKGESVSITIAVPPDGTVSPARSSSGQRAATRTRPGRSGRAWRRSSRASQPSPS